MVRTDHNSLVWLMRFRHIEGQLARWLEELAQFDMEILHRPGNKHINADAMSRLPANGPDCDCYVAGATPGSLPCGGCSYCVRAHNQWSRFAEDVDDVVPLARKCVPVDNSWSENTKDAFNIFAATLHDDHYPAVSWVEGYSTTDVARMQREDVDIGVVIKWLENMEDPGKSQLHLESPASRALWLLKERLCLKSDVLYYEWVDTVDRRFCLVVPTSLKKVVLELCHDSKTAGHLGQQKTYHRVRQSFYWHNLSQDCTEYVKGCSICNQNKKPHIKPRAALKSYHAGFPMERVHLDILGPFNTSESGNNYILMMIDQFTKWIEMAALPDQTAASVAYKFVTHFIVTFGCPMEVHTDQGRNFDSNLFQALCDELQIAKTRTTPYHPSSNGQVERYNTTVLQMIRCFIEKDSKYWDRDLPLLAMALHSTVHRQTGYTPNRLMLGREVIQPVHLITGNIPGNLSPLGADEWSADLSRRLTDAHHCARQNLKQAQLRQKRDYDLRVVEHHYDEGDLVYKLDSATKVGQSQKLRSPWMGPYLVIACRPPLYTIIDRKKKHVIHHDKLKLCQDRDIPVWLRRLRHQYFQTGDSLESSESLDEDVSYRVESQTDTSDVNVHLESSAVEQNPNYTMTDNIRHTRGGRLVKPPSKFKDFQV